MRLVVQTDPGVLEVRYTWLPVWLGINTRFLLEVDEAVGAKVKGLPITEDTLEMAHRLVLDYICEKNPDIEGLYTYLDALKYIPGD